MKLKKATKRKVKYILIGLMIIVMLIPIVTNFIPQKQSEGMDPKLLQAYLNSQNELSEEEKKETINIPQIEGTYQVTDVPSGNSITILWGDEERNVKLIGIKEVTTSKETLQKMLDDDFVQLEFDTIQEDEKGNLLAYAYHTDGRFINRELILFGNAKLDEKVSENTKYLIEFKDAQVAAKNNQSGCWEGKMVEEDVKK